MIALRFLSLREARESLDEGVREFESVLYRVTDRTRRATTSDYDLEWGHMILLLAWDGTIELILSCCKEQGEPPPSATLREHVARVRRDWAAYAAEFREDVARDLEEQFERSIIRRMRAILEVPGAFTTLEDIALYLDERDTAETFCEAAERQSFGRHFRQQLAGSEDRIRHLLVDHIGRALLREHGAAALDKLNVEWLPLDYWWRHIDWVGVGRSIR